MPIDTTGIPPDIRDHFRKIATPASVAIQCTSGPTQWRPAKHLMYLNRAVVRTILDKERQTFLNVQASVRHGKSVLLTIWTIVWHLGMFPDSRILVATGDPALGKKFSRMMKDIIRVHGPMLFNMTVGDKDTEEEWTTTNGGYVRVLTAGQNLVGEGFDLIVIDDPIASAKDARSVTVKRNMVDWYGEVIRTRLQPRGTMLFTMARWAEDDLSGTVVETAHAAIAAGLPADPWEVIKMPAVAVAPRGSDDSWRDVIGRREGEPLWPEMWSLEALMAIKNSLPNPRAWDALYQQNPVPPTGNMFDRAKWVKIDQRPAEVIAQVRAWDTAATDGRGSDWTVGMLMQKLPNDTTAIVDVVRFQGEVDEVELQILDTSRVDGPSVMIRMEAEKAGAGKLTNHHYSKLFPDRDFDTVTASGTKPERAAIVASAQRRGLISVLDSAFWAEELYSEYEKFPDAGRWDDQVDAGSLGYNMLWDSDGSTIALPGVFLSRGVTVPWSPDTDLSIPGQEWLDVPSLG